MNLAQLAANMQSIAIPGATPLYLGAYFDGNRADYIGFYRPNRAEIVTHARRRSGLSPGKGSPFAWLKLRLRLELCELANPSR
jgi:hypothetical protein